jgi:hypothetical protein
MSIKSIAANYLLIIFTQNQARGPPANNKLLEGAQNVINELVTVDG